MLKKTLLSLAVLGAVAAAAAPAAAQSWRGPEAYRDGGYQEGYGRPVTAYVDGLDWKIVNAARQGRISWDEARDLRHQFREVQPIAWRLQTGEASPWERARLERTVSRIEHEVNAPRWDAWQGRGDDERDGWTQDWRR